MAKNVYIFTIYNREEIEKMLITCHNCETIFQIEKSKIDPEGQQVRCSVCSHVWTVSFNDGNERTHPKLNLTRADGFSETKAQEFQGPKLRHDSVVKKKEKKPIFLGRFFWIIVICAILFAGSYVSIIYRTTVTAYFPAAEMIFKMAGLNISYSAENLSIEDLQIDWKEDILRVRGNIFNNSLMRIHTLPVKISIVDPSGLLLSTHEIWPDKAIIDASDFVSFFAQITIDADEKAEIQVDFTSK